ncbi:hypothetical protein SGLAD_v1c08360 [Spiroplasma gladiatoris]|uniref:Uncharacterized protein n=1 Tax=Spiroplasma gladiatoris TaxID=2143 RepID=A0A4P7AHV5_9MOLU|nr:hypothetical protein [Spiroplasma gladiatoris]QBQ08035.1 hypothetical protein SGLAD_v1c08360 [Spiroplasma gladiatoris]
MKMSIPGIWNDQLGFIPMWCKIIVIIGLCFALIAIGLCLLIFILKTISLASKTKKTKSLNVFEKAMISLGYEKSKVIFGAKKRYNSNFNYDFKNNELHLAQKYDDSDSTKSLKKITSDVANLANEKDTKTSIYSKSIYCNFLFSFGIAIIVLTNIVANFISPGYQSYFIGEVYVLMIVIGFILMFVAWFWWVNIFIKFNKYIDNFIKPTIEKEDYKKIKFIFILESLIPLTTNTLI